MVFNMRSELLGVDKHQTDSPPQSVRRRRMSKAVNGGGDNKISLAAAYHDHMSCTKFQDFGEVSLPCETDHIYANCSDSPKNSLREEARLKDIMLLNLDLIQHQQEQIQKKDLQIQKLKQENESLKIRLERMDRRISLLKQKELPSDSNSSSENSLSVSKQQAADSRSQRYSGRSAKRSYSNQSSPSKEIGDPQKSEKLARGATKFRRKSQEEEEIQYSENCYYTSVGETPPDNSRVSFPIEVPTWRYHPVSSCYQLEGTENIDDDVFLRRHLKLEQDERRRKRWDIQRLREQRHNEKLRRGRTLQKDSQKYNADSSSFCPSPRYVQYIEVTDSVPVTAFGHPIPKLQPCEFSLDWFDAESSRNNEDTRTKSKKCRSNGHKRGT